MKSRNTVYKTQAIVLGVAFVIILLLVNLIITKISDKYPITIDMTADSMFTISEESKDILSKMEKDVTIYLIESEKYPMDGRMTEIINRYRKYADGRIKVVSKDIVSDYSFASKFSEDISYGTIIFQCGEVYKTEYVSSFFGDDALLNEVENTITNDIIYVSSDANSLVYNVVGHGEADLGAVTTALNSENYTFKNIDLLNQNIPNNVSLLTVYAPKKDFSSEETAKINQFLKRGGSIQIYLDANTKGLTNLFSFAEGWGINISDKYIQEKDSDRLDMQNRSVMHPFITQYSFTDGIFGEDDIIMIQDSLALSYNGENEQKAQNVVAMLYTSKKATARKLEDSSLVSTGEQYPAILSTRYDGDTESNVFVAGTTDIFNSDYFAEGSRYANRDFYLKSIGWMCGFKDSIKISSKLVHSDVLTLSVSSGWMYTQIIFGISVIILVLGIVVWARRRYL